MKIKLIGDWNVPPALKSGDAKWSKNMSNLENNDQ